MRLDRLREGLLGGPLLPGGVFDARPLPYTVGPRAENVREAIGSLPAIAELQFLQSISPVKEFSPGLTAEFAQSKLRGAMQGDVHVPLRTRPPSSKFKEGLSQLSDLIQGKTMGRMVPEEPPLEKPWLENNWDDPHEKPFPEDNWGLPRLPRDEEVPLQNMRPVDPSYGDLFKKLRPYR